MLLNGEVYSPRSPLEANDLRISMVVQELGVVGSLSAGVNVYLKDRPLYEKRYSQPE